MKFLLGIPFIMSLARWVWGEDRAVTPEYCIEFFPIMNNSCWSRLIVKGLGIAIILGACLNKAPVVINILNTKSTEGLSRISIYGEILMYTNGALYGILEKHPFTAFGENLALVLQSLVIAFLVWKYTGGKEKINTNNGVTLQERFMTAILYVSYITCTFTILPDNLRYLLISSNVPIMLYSRGTQVLETFRIQHTGAQSVVTTTMNLVGTLIRILTTIKEVGWDFAILIGFALSLILNLTMFIQYFYYRSNTERFISQLQVQAEKKEK